MKVLSAPYLPHCATRHAAWALVVLAVPLLAGADWMRFRGPDANGISDDKGLPVQWGEKENVVWKTPLPGAGSSSPITLGDKIFLTCYSGYAQKQDEPGNVEQLTHHVVCLDRSTGRVLWDKREKALMPEKTFDSFITQHGYASATPVTDGRTVYVFFGRSGVFAYSLSGEKLWHADVGDKTHNWGSAASPVLWKNLVIVNASVESESLVALDAATGKSVWSAEGIKRSWSTPLVLDLPGGKQELIVSMQGKVMGFDPEKGQQLWECTSVPDYVCPAVVAHGDVVYITAGRKAMTLAIRAGGRGDVSKSNTLWQVPVGSKVPTPLCSDGLLTWVDQTGKVVCLDAANGKTVYEEKLKFPGIGDKVYASLVLGDGKLYGVTRQGGTVVLAPGKVFKELARNDLGDKSIFNGTPVISNGQILIRSNQCIYCIGK